MPRRAVPRRTRGPTASGGATHAARYGELYYEVNRGECGRDSRFGRARANSALAKTGGPDAGMLTREEVS